MDGCSFDFCLGLIWLVDWCFDVVWVLVDVGGLDGCEFYGDCYVLLVLFLFCVGVCVFFSGWRFGYYVVCFVLVGLFVGFGWFGGCVLFGIGWWGGWVLFVVGCMFVRTCYNVVYRYYDCCVWLVVVWLFVCVVWLLVWVGWLLWFGGLLWWVVCWLVCVVWLGWVVCCVNYFVGLGLVWLCICFYWFVLGCFDLVLSCFWFCCGGYLVLFCLGGVGVWFGLVLVWWLFGGLVWLVDDW